MWMTHNLEVENFLLVIMMSFSKFSMISADSLTSKSLSPTFNRVFSGGTVAPSTFSKTRFRLGDHTFCNFFLFSRRLNLSTCFPLYSIGVTFLIDVHRITWSTMHIKAYILNQCNPTKLTTLKK